MYDFLLKNATISLIERNLCTQKTQIAPQITIPQKIFRETPLPAKNPVWNPGIGVPATCCCVYKSYFACFAIFVKESKIAKMCI